MKKVILLALVVVFGLGMVTCQMQSTDVSAPEEMKEPNYDFLTSDCNSEPDTTEEVIIIVSGNDVTTVHKNAFYNCCSTLWSEVTQNGNLIRLDEFEDEPWCYCMCYRNITTTIYDLPVGEYLIEVYNTDGEYVGGGNITIPDSKSIRSEELVK